MTKSELANKRVFTRTVIIGGLLLALCLTLLQLGIRKVFGESDGLSQGIHLALKLLLFWLIVTSSVRTIVKIRKNISTLWLLLAGLLISAGGVFLHLLTMRIIAASKSEIDAVINYKSLLFFTAIGFIASIISIINNKVKSEFIGNVLEVLFIGVVAFLFFHFNQ